MTTLTVSVPRQAQEPRGARWLAAMAAALLKWVDGLGRTSTQAKKAQRGDSAELRSIARAFERTDPRLASELYAVADHSEAMSGR